jgi:hypothetical protein
MVRNLPQCEITEELFTNDAAKSQDFGQTLGSFNPTEKIWRKTLLALRKSLILKRLRASRMVLILR